MNLSAREVGRLLPWPVAIHEAGHAVVWSLVGVPVRSATIVPSEDSAGCVRVAKYLTWSQLEDYIAGLLAGQAAEKFFGVSQDWEERLPDGGMRYRSSASRDWGAFTQALREWHPDWPDSTDLYVVMEFVAPFMRNGLTRAEELVRQCSADIVRVAAALMKHKTLSAFALAELLVEVAA